MNNLLKPSELIEEMKHMLDDAQAQIAAANLSLEDVLHQEQVPESAKELDRMNKSLRNSITGYICGLKGEKAAYEATRFIPDIQLLKNIQTPGLHPGYTCEHDLIFITRKGIFDCEVKFNGAVAAHLTPQGILENTYPNGKTRIHSNVAKQVRAHRASIYRLLKNTQYKNVPIIPLILCANDLCTVTNEFEHIRTCYCNDAEYIILDENYSDCLEESDMEAIAGILKDADSCYEERSYPLPVSAEEYQEAVNRFIKDNLHSFAPSASSSTSGKILSGLETGFYLLALGKALLDCF